MNLIKKTIGLWRGADGKEAEVDIDLGGGNWYQPDWTDVDMLLEPRTRHRTAIVLSNGERFLLPTNETPRILMDRTGVFVVFDVHKTVSEGCISFAEPNNAAIFNADGRVRFFLKNPWGEEGHFRAITNATSKDNSPAIGVRACPKDWPTCEWVYVINGSTDDLSKQTPQWMRD
jgi:hypothetical protein